MKPISSISGGPGARRLRRSLTLATASVLAIAGVAAAAPPSVRGRVSGHEKLVLDVYSEAAKPDSKRWSWREPSPLVGAQYRALSAVLSRDVCVAVTGAQGAPNPEATLMSITGGRISPTTIVVAPGQKLSFKNFDPFPHRLYMAGNHANGWKPDNVLPNTVRDWTAPSGQNRFEIRDEFTPSIRTFVVVDPLLVHMTYPARDGGFAFSLPSGDYGIQAYFAGRKVGRPVQFVAKDKSTFDIKDALNLAEGGDSK
jgi:hypothetical protein